ncbi:MAG: 2-dehydropantoate 2-reductase [Pseudomonadota bacterium]
MTKIAIYGVGAVGGLIAARLALAGHPVSAIARGRTLSALQQKGLRIDGASGIETVHIRAEEEPASLGVQDFVIITVKGPALPEIAAKIAPLIGPHTTVVTAMNGIPWWFFEADAHTVQAMKPKSLDPHGGLSTAIPFQHILGCVVLFASYCPEPGLVKLKFGNKLILGEAAGGSSERQRSLIALLNDAGIDAEASLDIRTDIWRKLCGNMIMNPVSTLTGATAEQILNDPLVRAFCLAATQEAANLGARLGFPLKPGTDAQGALTLVSGPFKTSMLQDAEAGRPLEIDSLVTAVHEIAQSIQFPTPAIDSLLGLVRLYAHTRGIYGNFRKSAD